MGTDIHGWAQYSYGCCGDPKWENIMPVPDVRSYQIFNVLANVRDNELNSLADFIELRGLPRDIRNEDPDWYGDHTFTWYTLDEMLACFLPLLAQVDDTKVLDVWTKFIEYLLAWKNVQYKVDVRIVIGFDS